jgi:hypothetical protein
MVEGMAHRQASEAEDAVVIVTLTHALPVGLAAVLEMAEVKEETDRESIGRF